MIAGNGMSGARVGTGRQKRPPRSCGVLAIALAPILIGCSQVEAIDAVQAPPAQIATTTSLVNVDDTTDERLLGLNFNDESDSGGAAISFENSALARVDVDAVTWGTGQVRASVTPGGSRAIRLPAFSSSTDRGYAIVRVVNGGAEDVLSPGDRDFRFGADISLDATSTGSNSDDGDNVIQRGLYEGSSQYKLQVDDGRPSCRIRGLVGEAIVKSDVRVTAGEWYRMRCERRGTTVTLTVARLLPDGATRLDTVSRIGEVGAVIMPNHIPLSVGGKLGGEGDLLPASTDQFNGSIDWVAFRLLK